MIPTLTFGLLLQRGPNQNMVSLRSRVAAGLCARGKVFLSLRFRALLGGVRGKYSNGEEFAIGG